MRSLETLFLALLMIVLNSLDALFTVFYVMRGFASELNPLMAALLRLHTGAFLSFKLLLVNLLILGVWKLGGFERFKPLLHIVAGAYIGVLCWHLVHLVVSGDSI